LACLALTCLGPALGGTQDVLEQSCAGIGSSDVMVLIELNAGVTLCEASDVTCTCLDAIGCHDVMFQHLVV
jgi:hypothetical protein